MKRKGIGGADDAARAGNRKCNRQTRGNRNKGESLTGRMVGLSDKALWWRRHSGVCCVCTGDFVRTDRGSSPQQRGGIATLFLPNACSPVTATLLYYCTPQVFSGTGTVGKEMAPYCG